jgi:hypothetical protein
MMPAIIGTPVRVSKMMPKATSMPATHIIIDVIAATLAMTPATTP